MKDKKEEQARLWREQKKKLKEVGKAWQTELDQDKAKERDDETTHFKPLTEEEQKEALACIKKLRDNNEKYYLEEAQRCVDLLKKGDTKYLESYAKCYQSIGRATAYELLETLFLGENETYKNYKEHLIAYGKE